MRLQLTLSILLCLVLFSVYGQDSTYDYPNAALENVESQFLFSYYDQDGNHSAVTGGKGTEELKSYSPNIIVNIPVDSNGRKVLFFDGGIDYYTSASTDKIDYNVSSASAEDIRSHMTAGYRADFKDKRLGFEGRGSYSIESDYISYGLGLSFYKVSPTNRTQFYLEGQLYHDILGWGWFAGLPNQGPVYPIELRYKEWFSNDIRNSYTLELTISHLLSHATQVDLIGGIGYQKGLLSTPFHRVYFQGLEQARVEQLPDSRIKIPLAIQLHQALSGRIFLRSYYRYYFDDFGIQSNTFSIEIPVKISESFSVFPLFRFYAQTAAKYFKPYKEHSLDQEFYTSDYDLSKFTSIKYGGGFRIAPPPGIFRYNFPFSSKKRKLKSLDFRAAGYQRSDGLSATIFSIGLSFSNY